MGNNELALFQLAQRVTDDVLGPGTYERLNKFNPSKGQTHYPYKPEPLKPPVKYLATFPQKGDVLGIPEYAIIRACGTLKREWRFDVRLERKMRALVIVLLPRNTGRFKTWRSNPQAKVLYLSARTIIRRGKLLKTALTGKYEIQTSTDEIRVVIPSSCFLKE